MFWKKNNTVFKIGDAVKIKKGIKHPKLKIKIDDWHGRVCEVDEKTIEMELDSITLQNMTDVFINHYEDSDEYPYLITVPKKQLELTEPRDKYEEVEIAQDELIENITLNNEPGHDKLAKKWARHFQRSRYYYSLKKAHRENSDFIFETFTDYMQTYEGKSPKEWDVSSARSVCLEWVPKKITAETTLFESYGEVLSKFFEFLASRNYLPSAKSLHNLIEDIKEKIVENSQNSSNWGMAKSFFMGAQNSGVDMSSEEGINRYMLQQQLKAFQEISTLERNNSQEEIIDTEKLEKEQRATKKLEQEKLEKKQRANKYKHLGRNDKVSVKYQDGSIKQEIKFKKVAKDLMNGNCELMPD